MNVDNRRLGDFMTSRRTKGKEGLPTLSVTLDRGLVRRDSLERKTETNLKAREHLRVLPGDIAYNMMRMWQGASGLAQTEALVSPAYVVLAPKPNLDPLFAAYLFKTSRMIHYFWAYSYGLTNDRLRLYPNDALKVPVSIPSLPEQEKIADILSTWDRAIETTEALLKTARKQKRALMQQLLTGKRRFPEFEGQEWQEVRLGDVADIRIGGTPSRKQTSFWNNGTNVWLSIADLGPKYIISSKEMITDEGVAKSNVKLLPAGTVVMSFKLTIGKLGICRNPMYTNEAICGFVAKSDQAFDPEFLYQLLHVADLLTDVDQAVKGKTLNKAKLNEIVVRMPNIQEQKRIAKFLLSVDQDVLNIEDQIEKLRIEKKALMQQLLTGKRRVVLDAE